MSRIMKRLFGWSSKKKETERATDETESIINTYTSGFKGKGDYKGAEQLYCRAVKGIIKVSRKMGSAHPRKNNLVNNYVGCLQKMGMNEKQIKQKLEAVLIETERN